jgi:hypothetical protein
VECDEPFVCILPNIGSIISFDESVTDKPRSVVTCTFGAWKTIQKNLKQDSPIIADSDPVTEVGGDVEGAPQRRTPDQWVRRRRRLSNNSNRNRYRTRTRTTNRRSN